MHHCDFSSEALYHDDKWIMAVADVTAWVPACATDVDDDDQVTLKMKNPYLWC